MKKEIDFLFWSNIQKELRQLYPQLTNADLYWRDGSNQDMFRLISAKLGITRKELEDIIDRY